MTVQRMLPLYEGKMIHLYDHRWSTNVDGDSVDTSLESKRDPGFEPVPRYWVRESLVQDRLAKEKSRKQLVGYRWISNATNERTFIQAAHPVAGVGNSEPVLLGRVNAVFLAMSSSFVVDYVARQKLGGQNMTFSLVRQLTVLHPSVGSFTMPFLSQEVLETWVSKRVNELIQVTWAMAASGQDASDACGPFLWDEERRFWLRAELDAAFFHLYGVERDDVDYIMETFPIVKRKDVAAHGEYRTKRAILEIYDAMQRAIDSGTEYQTVLDPPPGQGPRHEGED